jgi:predicted metal-binding protein
MTTWITICDTCKRDDWSETTHSRPHGEDMAELVEKHAKGRNVRTRRTSCLMGCSHGCNIAIQAEGKLAYTLGRFEPTDEAASGIVVNIGGPVPSTSYGTVCVASQSGTITVEVISVPPTSPAP